MKLAEYLFDQNIADTTINDTSGQGNDATINPVRAGLTPARIVEGVAPEGYRFKSLKFDVDAMPTDHGLNIEPDDQLQFMSVPANPSIRSIDSTRAFTISFWAYHEVLDTSGNPWDGPRTLMGKELFCPQHVCGAEAFYVFVRTKNDTDDPESSVIPEERGELAFTGDGPKIVGAGGISDADTPQTDLGGTTTPAYHVPINSWVHMACVVEPPAGAFPGRWKFYVDGDLKGQRDALPDLADAAQPIFPVDPRVDIRFGNFRSLNRPNPIAFGANDYAFNGYLTGIRIFDHAQTPAEICDDISTDTGTPQVELLTPSIDFGLVAEGLTTVRPVRLSLRGCKSAMATASFVTNDGAFGLPLGATRLIPGINDLSTRSEEVIWVSYRADAPGTSNSGRLRVQVPDAGLDEVIDLAGLSVARPSVSAVLVLDRSFSMDGEAGVPGIKKIDLLREAARSFIDVMREGDQIGLVRYNQDAPPPHFGLTDVGVEELGAGRNDARTFINGSQLVPAGNTSIGDGIFEASNLLDASADDVKAMVVMTDGKENRSRFIADVTTELTNQTYAVGLGTPAGINRDKLDSLTRNSGGYLLVTGEMNTNNRFRLRKFFLQILSDIENTEIIVDPQGIVTPNGPQAISFAVNEADVEADVFLMSENPDGVVLALEAPNGNLINPTNVASFPNVRLIRSNDVAYYRLLFPAFLDDQEGHRGVWKAWVGHAKGQDDVPSVSHLPPAKAGAGIRYSVVARARSSVNLDVALIQDLFEPGSPFAIQVRLRQFDLPLTRNVRVRVIIERPDGSTDELPLFQDADLFTARYEDTFLPGAYQVRVVAEGRSLGNHVIQREKLATGMIVKDGTEAEELPNGLSNALDETNSKLKHLNICCGIVAVLLFLLLLYIVIF